MRRVLLSFIIFLLITTFSCGPGDLFASNKTYNLVKSQNTKSGFTENKGQIIDQNNRPNPGVLFLLNSPGINVQLRRTGFSYDVFTIDSSNQKPFALRHSPFAPRNHIEANSE
jgi:hypothetical protein